LGFLFSDGPLSPVNKKFGIIYYIHTHIYTEFIAKAHQTSIELLSMWCRVPAFLLASSTALSQGAENGKTMSNQPALWTCNIKE
jgi:hypothetical protein